MSSEFEAGHKAIPPDLTLRRNPFEPEPKVKKPVKRFISHAISEPLSDDAVSQVKSKIAELAKSSRVKNLTARGILLDELRGCLLLQLHLEQLIVERELNSEELQSKNSNAKNILKYIEALGIGDLSDPAETDLFADTDADTDDEADDV
jgi:hypothetical protein